LDKITLLAAIYFVTVER